MRNHFNFTLTQPLNEFKVFPGPPQLVVVWGKTQLHKAVSSHPRIAQVRRLPTPSGHRCLGGDHKCTRHLHLTQPLVEFTVFPRPLAHRCLGEDSTKFHLTHGLLKSVGSPHPQVIVAWGETSTTRGSFVSPTDWLSPTGSPDPQVIVAWGEDF